MQLNKKAFIHFASLLEILNLNDRYILRNHKNMSNNFWMVAQLTVLVDYLVMIGLIVLSLDTDFISSVGCHKCVSLAKGGMKIKSRSHKRNFVPMFFFFQNIYLYWKKKLRSGWIHCRCSQNDTNISWMVHL